MVGTSRGGPWSGLSGHGEMSVMGPSPFCLLSSARALLCQVMLLCCAVLLTLGLTAMETTDHGQKSPTIQIKTIFVFASWFYQIFCYSKCNPLTQGQDANNILKTITRFDCIHPNCPQVSLAKFPSPLKPIPVFFVEPNMVSGACCQMIALFGARTQLHCDPCECPEGGISQQPPHPPALALFLPPLS